MNIIEQSLWIRERKMDKIKKRRFFAVNLVCLVLFSLIISTISVLNSESRNTKADGLSVADSLLLKVIKNDFIRCISNGHILKMSPVENSNEYTENDIFYVDASSYGEDGLIAKVPYKYGTGNTLDDANLSCKQVFEGFGTTGGSNKNIFQTYSMLGGKQRPPYKTLGIQDSIQDKNKFLEILGYRAEATVNSNAPCLQVVYNVSSNMVSSERKTNKICVNFDEKDKKITEKNIIDFGGTDSEYFTLKFSSDTNKIQLMLSGPKTSNCNVTPTMIVSTGKLNDLIKKKNASEIFGVLKTELDNKGVNFLNQEQSTGSDPYNTGRQATCPGKTLKESLGADSVNFKDLSITSLGNQSDAGSTNISDIQIKKYTYPTSTPNINYTKLMQYYVPSYVDGEITHLEKAYYWYYLLKDVFKGISVDKTLEKTCVDDKSLAGDYYLQYYGNSGEDSSDSTKTQYCILDKTILLHRNDEKIMKNAPGNGLVMSISSVNEMRYMSAEEVLNLLNGINLTSICSEDSNFPLCKSTPLDCQKDPNGAGCKDINGANATENEDDKQNSEQAVCMQNAGSLGWIVCPMIYGLRDAANGIFKNTVTPLLRVHDSIVEALAGNSESSTMYQAWSFFRNIGNILFVLAMLFVIFSQITGFGIDNYGIKKILPKLIVTAIIVNFSYIICGALVDLSNIAGDGIKNIFESVATNLSGNTTPSFTDNVAGSVIDIVAFIGAGAAVAGSVATVAGAVTSGSLLTIIVPILAFVGSALIAGLFAMLMLGLRQALIIIMIAISPVAFVLYAIPNTSGIFKKWLQLFKTLLILYPVFCFMSGGGFLASNLIIKGTNEFYMKLIAGLISIAPFFMVPSMTKSAMKGFDGAVSGLSNLQSRVNRTGDTINRRVMNSDTMKSQAENAQLGKYRRLAERYKNTDTSKLGQWRKRQVIAAFNALTKSEHQDAVLDAAKSQYRFDTNPVNKENARVSAMREIDEKNKQQIMSGYADRNMSAGEALLQLDTAQRDYKYSDHSEQENHDHDVELAALQSHLLSTKDGQKMYNSYLSGKETDTGVVGENGNKVTIKAGATSDRAKAVLARDYVNKHSDLKDKYQISFAQMRNIQGAGPVEKMKTEISTANSLATNRQSGVDSFAESIDLKDIDKLGNKDAEELVQANLSGDSAQNTTAAVNAIVQQAESDPSKAGTYTPEIKRLIRRYSSNHTDLDNLGSRSFVVRDASGNVQQTIRLEQNNNNNNNQSS